MCTIRHISFVKMHTVQCMICKKISMLCASLTHD